MRDEDLDKVPPEVVKKIRKDWLEAIEKHNPEGKKAHEIAKKYIKEGEV